MRKAEHEINRLTEENVYLEKERQQLELTVKQLKEQLVPEDYPSKLHYL